MNDLHLVSIVEAYEGLLEAALADVAPRTDEVGPDVDAHTTSISVAGAGSVGAGFSRPSFSAKHHRQLARGGLIHCDRASRLQCKHLNPPDGPRVRVAEAV